MTVATPQRTLSIPSDEDKLSPGVLDLIERNLPQDGSSPTRETVLKICVDDDHIVSTAEKREILHYLLMVSSLELDDLKPLWADLEQYVVASTFGRIKKTRREREMGDWKPKWPTRSS